MAGTVLKCLLLLVLPPVVLVGGSLVLQRACDRAAVRATLEANTGPSDRRPLGLRARGYDALAVRRHWGALEAVHLRTERRFLELDLLFPLALGAALLAGLLGAWTGLGRPVHVAWIVAPVLLFMLSDWTENLALLSQLKSFLADRALPLDQGSIRVASLATTTKLLAFLGSEVLLLVLCLQLAIRSARHS